MSAAAGRESYGRIIMSKKLKTMTLMVAVLVAGMTAASAEDLTIVSKVMPTKGETFTSTQYLSPDAMRIDNGHVSTIVDFSSGKITQLDNRKKTYYVTTVDEMRQHLEKLNEMVQSNAMMKKLLGTMSEVQVQQTDETKEIAGYTCHKILLSMGDNFKETLWVTTQLEVPTQYYDARKMLYAMMGPIASKFDKMLDAMKKVKGLALASDVETKVMGFDASSTSEAQEVKKGPIPAVVFQAPPGYKQVKSPLAG
jgi:hypothetical protein